MSKSKAVNAIWNNWQVEKSSKQITELWLKSEEVAETRILPDLGFTYVMRFSSLDLRRGTQYRLFSYDIYAERLSERWLIDISLRVIKNLEVSMMNVLKRMGISNFGVILIDKTLTRYIFKEVQIKTGQRTISVGVNRDDFVVGLVKNVPEPK